MNSEIGYEFTMKHPWFSVPVLLCEIKIPPTFKCVYLHILRRAGGVADFNMTTRRCFETQTSLAQNAGVDRKTVREAYRWLVAHKMIRVLESERNKPTIVEVTSTHEWIIPKGSRVLESNEEGHKKETKTIARGELGRFTKKEPQEQKGVGESAPPTNHRAEENTSPCEKDVIDNIEQQITVLGNPLTVETTVLGNPHPTTVIKNDAESTVSWGNDRSRLGETTALDLGKSPLQRIKDKNKKISTVKNQTSTPTEAPVQPREFSEDAPEGGSPIGERNSSVLSEEVAGDNSLSKAMPIPSPSPKPAKKDNWKFENGSEKEFHAYMGIIETMSRISLLLKEFDEAELEIPVGTMARITHNNRVKKYILQQGEGDFYLGLRWAQAAVLATRDRCKWQKSKADDTAAKWFKPCIYSIFSKNIPAKLHQQIKEYVMGNKMRTIGYDYEADKSHYTDLLESARENAKNGVD